ncbi:phage repressor protein C with HTH and peptisase S24 domain [Caulobacter sp. BE264]|uniref:S24 family peptidase n=1 Tax=Caulobacter sp. BE264 TaxID=2817724 RepID=UPI002862FFF3|nr:S24 family peptidase [Caulobacter sp. BE264]MDR7230612.1 phage repressor protein C with HTH and peptisase S24 domain [Caulobacter sp. BE264]
MSDLTDWHDVADRLVQMKRGAKHRLAKHLKMDPSYLARKLGKGGGLTIKESQAIEEFLDSPDEAFASAEAMTFTPDSRAVRDEPAHLRVPVYGYAAASGGDRIAFNTGEIIDWMELPMGMAPRGEVFVVRALGSSMEPRIFDGESLVIQRNVPPTRDRDALIEFNDGSGVVKTYKGQRDGQVFAHQYNEDRELRYPATSVKALHTVFCRL